MTYRSTQGSSPEVGFADAVLSSLAPDGGLYVPTQWPSALMDLDPVQDLAIAEIADRILAQFVSPDLTLAELHSITADAYTFDAPLRQLADELYVLELFHGPTAAFKDFGVRFMARVVAKFAYDKEITVLTATSGDTGGAVAAAFARVAHTRAVILYPRNKVSRVQEAQIASHGANIIALEVEGNFDDCQRLVKAAFADKELTVEHSLISANSINIARLLPQMIYYFRALGQLRAQYDNPPAAATYSTSHIPSFVVPSGNFGNLTAGLYAKKLGLPARRFRAVTNANDVVPRYLATGHFEPGAFVETLTNAMDIANPSNWARIEDLYGHDFSAISHDVSGIAISDEQTMSAIAELYHCYGYLADPHTSTAYTGSKSLEGIKVLIAIAHPQKFPETVGKVTSEIPRQPFLPRYEGKEFVKRTVPPTLQALRESLLS